MSMNLFNKQTLLVLGGSQYQLPLIRCANALGCRVIAVDKNPHAPASGEADVFEAIDTIDADAILTRFEGEQIDGVVAPATDVAVVTQARIAQARRLWGPAPEAASILTDKILFRRFQNKIGCPAPKWREVDAIDDFPSSEFAAEYIVKPALGSGGKGTYLSSSLQDAANYCLQAFEFNPRVILEEAIQGFHGTVEGVFDKDGFPLIFFTDRTPAAPPNAATVRHEAPTFLSADEQSLVTEQLREIFHSLGIERCYFDCDFIICREERTAYILEMSPRLGGNSLSKLLRLFWGVDVNVLAVSLAIDGLRDGWSETAVPLAKEGWREGQSPAAAAICILGASKTGKLSCNKNGLSILAQKKWVHEIELDYPVGATIKAFENGRDRVGEALLSASGREELRQRIIQMTQTLSIEAV